jgi:PAS domain S-box-containing protein
MLGTARCGGTVAKVVPMSSASPFHEPAAAALQESEARFRLIAETIGHVFWVLELQPQERVSYVSPAFEQIWGRRAEELYADARLWTEAIVREDRGAVLRTFEHWLAAPHATSFVAEYRIHRPDGELRWIADRGRAVLDGAGQPQRVTGLAEDITARKQAEAAAQASQHQFRQFLESLPQLVWSADPLGECDYLSPQWLAYTGVPLAEQLGRGWLHCVHPEDREAAQTSWRTAVQAQTVFDSEYRLLDADGRARWFAARGTLLRDETGRPQRWLGTSTDIDELKRAAAALADERDRLTRLAEVVPGALHTYRRTPAGRFSFPFGGDRVAALLGMADTDLSQDGTPITALTHPEDRPRVLAAVQASATNASAWHVEYRVRHPQLGERWIEGRSMPSPAGADGMDWHGTLIDITERKHAEQALAESRARLAAVFTHVNEGLVLCSLDGLLYEWNPAALRLHGFASLAEASRPLPEFQRIFELFDCDDRPLPLERWPLARVLAGERFEHMEVRLHHRQQGWDKVFDYGGTLARDAQGRPLLAVVHFNDISERHRQAGEVRQLNAQLELRVQERTAELQAAVKELEAFSYSVSHDLRAPLRALDGFSQALLQDHAAALPAEGQRYLHIIRDSATRMGQLIDDLLAFSRIGRAPLKRHRIDPALLVRDAMNQLAPLTQGRRIELQVNELPPCLGDLAMLRQVWINLLSNAVKYTRQRDPARIEVGAVSDAQGTVTYHVRDNGAGFDMRYAHKLFGVFERLHRADEFEGTGVGLAIVQRIVQRHGGSIRAEASPGQGAAFYFNVGPATP